MQDWPQCLIGFRYLLLNIQTHGAYHAVQGVIYHVVQGVIFHALQGVTYHAVHGGIHNAMQGVHFIMVTLFGLFGDLPGDAWLPSWGWFVTVLKMVVYHPLGNGLPFMDLRFCHDLTHKNCHNSLNF